MAGTIADATVAGDLAYALLTLYVKGKAIAQTIQDKPLLSWLRQNSETFAGGGNSNSIKGNVQGAFMSDAAENAGFLQGYSENDAVEFYQANNIEQWEYYWREVSMGLLITWTELKKDGITITDEHKVSEHSRADMLRITKVFQNRLDDFGESNMRAMNLMNWGDGSADAKHIIGLTGLMGPAVDPTTAGTLGGLARTTYTWWQWRAKIGANKLVADKTNQTMTKTLRSELRQLRRYGGKPNKVLCGSDFLEALEEEVHEKGTYTDSGFVNEGKNDIGMASIRMRGLGTFEYDPTMDDLALSKFAYALDGRRCKQMVMEGEDMKVLNPARPYNYMVFLKNVTWTGALVLTQPNACGVWEVA